MPPYWLNGYSRRDPYSHCEAGGVSTVSSFSGNIFLRTSGSTNSQSPRRGVENYSKSHAMHSRKRFVRVENGRRTGAAARCRVVLQSSRYRLLRPASAVRVFRNSGRERFMPDFFVLSRQKTQIEPIRIFRARPIQNRWRSARSVQISMLFTRASSYRGSCVCQH